MSSMVEYLMYNCISITLVTRQFFNLLEVLDRYSNKIQIKQLKLLDKIRPLQITIQPVAIMHNHLHGLSSRMR